MNYISIREASEKWKISDRRIRVLCSEGRIEGAVKVGRSWSIPSLTVKPATVTFSWNGFHLKRRNNEKTSR